MSSAIAGTRAEQSERVLYGKLLVAGLIALAGSVVGNQLVRAIAVALLRPEPGFMPLQVGPPIFFSVIGVLGALGVYALIGRLSRRPVTLFKRVALATLLLSLVPNLLMLVNPFMPGTTPPNVLALMLMHVVAWYVSVEALTRLAGEKG